MRRDIKRTAFNKLRQEQVKKLLDKAQKDPSANNIKEAISAVDKLAKVKVIHKNKAARVKSRLAKLGKKQTSAKETKVVKKVRKKK